MAIITRAVRGTHDILPAQSHKWQFIEHAALSISADFGYGEIRTPVFEHTELFSRSVGETTDVVQKEMYTFDDKGKRSITLRPEGTAGAMRAVLEHGLHAAGLPVKVCYLIGCYRYENPQSGRYREFRQFGAECLGAAAPQADAEIISLAWTMLNSLGVTGVSLRLNSIGCPKCRPEYHAALKEYFAGHKDKLCGTCMDRLERNPMRIMDCKSPVCSAIAEGAPVTADYLCNDCREHFDGVKACLDAGGIEYAIDTGIVRGLDYYTRTVFEFVSDALGAQSVICGGGRYDGLSQELGGPSLPSLGFAMGLERLLMVMEAKNAELPPAPRCEYYFAPMGEAAVRRCFELVTGLRGSGVPAEYDIVGRGIKAQMKYADKIGAKFTVVIGDNELESGKAMLRNMSTGEQTPIELDDSLCSALQGRMLDSQLADMAELFGGI